MTEAIRVLARYKSRTSDRVYKVVVSLRGGPPACDCPGFTYRNHCRHVAKWTPEALAERYAIRIPPTLSHTIRRVRA